MDENHFHIVGISIEGTMEWLCTGITTAQLKESFEYVASSTDKYRAVWLIHPKNTRPIVLSVSKKKEQEEFDFEKNTGVYRARHGATVSAWVK